jgi:hypothetical protein
MGSRREGFSAINCIDIRRPSRRPSDEIVLVLAAHDHPIEFDFPVVSGRFSVAPLLADTNVLPDGHALVHRRILSARETDPEIPGKWVATARV